MQMTDEEIEAWREERRLNWPTAENIKRKEAERKEREKEEAKLRARPQPKEVRFKKKKPTFLETLFQGERKVEADLLIQCFEHIKEVALRVDE